MGRIKKIKGYVFKSTYERCFFTTRRPIKKYECLWANPKAKTIELTNLELQKSVYITGIIRFVGINEFKKATLLLEIE